MALQRTNSRGITYHLHGKLVELKGGRKQQIYYFAKTERPESAVHQLPEGYEVTETARTGLPILKKIKTEAK